jgi:hypothetical protein
MAPNGVTFMCQHLQNLSGDFRDETSELPERQCTSMNDCSCFLVLLD